MVLRQIQKPTEEIDIVALMWKETEELARRNHCIRDFHHECGCSPEEFKQKVKA